MGIFKCARSSSYSPDGGSLYSVLGADHAMQLAQERLKPVASLAVLDYYLISQNHT